MSAFAVDVATRPSHLPASILVTLPIRFLHAWVSAPVFMFLLALTAMLFRPPDLKAFPWDRIAFVALVGCLGLRFCIQRERLKTYPATWPMLALLLLCLWLVRFCSNVPQTQQ